METELFVITDVQWEYGKLRENTGAVDHPAEVFKKAIRSADIQCRGCSRRWKAGTGNRPGQLQQAIGSVQITCPQCGTRESVAASLL